MSESASASAGIYMGFLLVPSLPPLLSSNSTQGHIILLCGVIVDACASVPY